MDVLNAVCGALGTFVLYNKRGWQSSRMKLQFLFASIFGPKYYLLLAAQSPLRFLQLPDVGGLPHTFNVTLLLVSNNVRRSGITSYHRAIKIE
jgi:hypothetical protein